MEDTLGPEGLDPSAVLFRDFSKVCNAGDATIARVTLATRADVAHNAPQEMENMVERLRLRRALRHDVPPAAYESYQPGHEILVWRENILANRIGEWMGPNVSYALIMRRRSTTAAQGRENRNGSICPRSSHTSIQPRPPLPS